ncbi:uncharacterized protein [Dermacentor andersoni]|uniref:uncharacterized protein n=1 Tax=Dermacentor andersoni TaxID=34620 RepID=UPI003B3B81A0
MADERSNEYTPPVFSFTDEATISSSRENTQGASSSLSAYTTIPETTGVDEWNTQCHPAGAPSTVSGHTHSTETGSTNSTLLVYSSSGGVYNAVASTSYARMEEPSGIFGNDAWNSTGSGGKEEQELSGVCGNVSSGQDALHGHANERTGDTAPTCKTSDVTYVKDSKFVKHCRNRTGKPHKYESCGKSSGQAANLAAHCRTHTCMKPYIFICDQSFRQSVHLDNHMCTHTGEKPYVCNICDKSFRQSVHLGNHIRTHTGEKPYVCNICDKSFRQSVHLGNHIRTHTGEKPYVCKVCDQSFRQSSHLDNHMRTHTGEKPYICKICDKSFRQSVHLGNHMRTHKGEKPYICKTCPKSFTRLASLRRHQQTHTDGKPRVCQTCWKPFKLYWHSSDKAFVCEICHRQRKHGDKTPYECTQGGFIFAEKETLDEHLWHSNTCYLCGDSFGDEVQLLTHLVTHRDVQPRYSV